MTFASKVSAENALDFYCKTFNVAHLQVKITELCNASVAKRESADPTDRESVNLGSASLPAGTNSTGAEYRDEGIDQVTARNQAWMDEVRNYFIDDWLPTKPTGHRFIAEDFRRDATTVGIEPPEHHNAWGAFFNQIVKTRLIKNTGTTRESKTPSSHARRMFIYEKV